MRVLVAVDGSAGSAEAVREASRLTSAGKDQLAFYYSPVAVKPKAGSDATTGGKARTSLAEAIFDESRSQLPDVWRSKVETIVGDEPAKHGVLHAARDWKADLIVVGARGLGPIQRMLLGSVSRSVVQQAIVPVLVARSKKQSTSGLRVLVAAEDCHHARQLTTVLDQITWPADTTAMLLSVVQPMHHGQIPAWVEQRARDPEIKAMADAWAAEHATEVEAKRREMEESCDTLPGPWRGQKPLVLEGQPAEMILEAVAKQNVDLLVMGARGANPLTQLLLGSTSAAVVGHAPCSVLIVRER